MKESHLILIIISLIMLNCSSKTPPQPICQDDNLILQKMEQSLKTDLLDVWYPRSIDLQNGGFHATFNHKWDLVSSTPKIIVPQSRGLYTASKSAIRYPENTIYRKAADHGFKFLKEQAWDPVYGGFYHNAPDSKNPPNEYSYKSAYGNSFAIYALSAYYELTQDKEALELAIKTFNWLNDNLHDPVYGGYFQYCNRQGVVYKTKDSWGKIIFIEPRQSFATYKEYNSSIHLLEAFTSLYHEWPDAKLRDHLMEIFTIVRDTMLTDKGYLELIYTDDWKHVSNKDKSRKYIIDNSYFDHVSFGHDTETAFLLLEAASLLDKSLYEETLNITRPIMNHSFNHGFDDAFSGVFYEGYYFKGDSSLTVINPQKQWWVQAEAMNAYLMFSILYPEDSRYKKAFFHLWHFINQYHIDHEYGGWYSEAISSKPKKNKRRFKAVGWKSNYHNYRAMSQCIDMLKTKTIPFLNH